MNSTPSVATMVTSADFFLSLYFRKLTSTTSTLGQSPICNVEKFVPGKEWIRVRELKHDRSGLSLLRVPNIFELIKI